MSNRRKHEKRTHILCSSCNYSYVHDDKSPHICIDLEPISGVATETDLGNLLDQIRYRNEPKLQRLLSEMRACKKEIDEQLAVGKDKETLWKHCLDLGIAILENLDWASIGVKQGSSLGRGSSTWDDADMWYVTWEDLDTILDAEESLSKVIVVADTSPNVEEIKEKFFQRLVDRHGDVECVDVQLYAREADESSSAGKETALRIKEKLLSSWGRSFTLTNKDPPWNLLNLANLLEELTPKILGRQRFQVVPTLDSRIVAESSGGGKRRTAPLRFVDIMSCRVFTLCAQRGSVSGPHVDALNGTFVRCLTGGKLWPFAQDLSEQDLESFKEHGDRWIPRRGVLKAAYLEPGHTIIMPAGKFVIHAPITVEDCIMDGGQLWDEHKMDDVLRNIHCIVKSPNITNEASAVQLPTMLDQLLSFMKVDPRRFARTRDADEYLSLIEGLVAGIKRDIVCECERCRLESCPCKQARGKAKVCRLACHGGRRQLCNN